MLYDELLASNFPYECTYPGLRRLREAVVFRIDEVGRYVTRTYQGEGRPVDLTHDLPTVAPPAEVCWLEYDTAGCFGPEHRRLATLLIYQDLRPEWRPETYPEARWLMDTFPILEHNDGSVTVDDFVICYLLDGAGALISQGQHDYAYKHLVSARGDPQAIANGVKSFPALLAVTFSHCKGVLTPEHQQPRQQRRAWERHGHKTPLTTFRTIDIIPVTGPLGARSPSTAGSLRTALHAVRGHLRHYEPGQYFGRNRDPLTIYIPLHLRGSSAEGVRFHDYRVHPPT